MDIGYILIAAGGVIVGLLSLIVMIRQKSTSDQIRRDEHQQEYGKTTEILCGLDKQLLEIKVKLDTSDAKLNDIYERVIRTEESVKQAHARIDEIRDKTYGYLNRKEDKV